MHDNEPQVSYRHKNGDVSTRFVQYAKDPVPAWAVDVQSHVPSFEGHVSLTARIKHLPNLRPEKVEEFRMELRRRFLQYVFGAADAVEIDHRYIEVDASIKLTEG